MNDTVVSILLAALLFGFAGYRLYLLLKQNRRNKISQAWPVAQAQVLAKQVHIHRQYKGYLVHTPVVNLKYRVAGKTYTEDIRMSGPWTKESAQQAVDAIGKTMAVRYNPQNPAEMAHKAEKPVLMDYILIVVPALLALGLVILQLVK